MVRHLYELSPRVLIVIATRVVNLQQCRHPLPLCKVRSVYARWAVQREGVNASTYFHCIIHVCGRYPASLFDTQRICMAFTYRVGCVCV